MFDARRIQSDFSAAAARYDSSATLQQSVLSRLVERAAPLLQPHAHLLDAGSGTGRLARQLSHHAVTQLDIAFLMCLKSAENRAPAVNGTMGSLPFRDAAFDGVLSSLALQWTPSPRAALDEMWRVTKPGGLVAVSTLGPATLHELKASFAETDAYAHVSDFPSLPEFHRSEAVTEYYPDMLSLMRHLKNIGARNKLLSRRKSLMSRSQMQRAEHIYRARFGTERGLPATWEILCLIRQKP